MSYFICTINLHDVKFSSKEIVVAKVTTTCAIYVTKSVDKCIFELIRVIGNLALTYTRLYKGM